MVKERPIAKRGVLMGNMALDASPPEDAGDRIRRIEPCSSAIPNSNGKEEDSGEEMIEDARF